MYLVAGMVARSIAGPGVIFSFIIAAVASIFSGINVLKKLFFQLLHCDNHAQNPLQVPHMQSLRQEHRILRKSLKTCFFHQIKDYN